MNRREALAKVAAITGGVVVGANAFLSGCVSSKETPGNFSPDVLALLDEIGETIMPETPASPGAKAAKIGAFMQSIVSECYTPEEQKIFHDGVKTIDDRAAQTHQKNFMAISAPERHALLVALDDEAKAYASKKEDDEPVHYFSMLKQLTLWGYFTSEVGSKKALRYVPIPGRYEGCIPYNKGDGAWAAI